MNEEPHMLKKIFLSEESLKSDDLHDNKYYYMYNPYYESIFLVYIKRMQVNEVKGKLEYKIIKILINNEWYDIKPSFMYINMIYKKLIGKDKTYQFYL